MCNLKLVEASWQDTFPVKMVVRSDATVEQITVRAAVVIVRMLGKRVNQLMPDASRLIQLSQQTLSV